MLLCCTRPDPFEWKGMLSFITNLALADKVTIQSTLPIQVLFHVISGKATSAGPAMC